MISLHLEVSQEDQSKLSKYNLCIYVMYNSLFDFYSQFNFETNLEYILNSIIIILLCFNTIPKNLCFQYLHQQIEYFYLLLVYNCI